MIAILSAALLLVLVLLILMFTRRELRQRRSVLLHAPPDSVWPRLEPFHELLAQHGHGRSIRAFDQHSFVRGHPTTAGSVWRSRGIRNGSDDWVDIEIVRYEPGRSIAIRLRDDSLGTHRGLRRHLGTLTLSPNGEASSKLTWELRAQFRPTRLILARHFGMERLKARLLDLSLRSIKGMIDHAELDRPEGQPSAVLASDRLSEQRPLPSREAQEPFAPGRADRANGSHQLRG